MRRASRSTASKVIIGSSVRPWALIQPGIKEGHQSKMHCRVPHPLERGFLEKVRDIMKSNKQATAGHLILRLNPVIRGWAHYHRHSASKRTFDKVDSAIFEALWRWAKRRHPHKPPGWVKRKYFRSMDNRQWVFREDVVDPK